MDTRFCLKSVLTLSLFLLPIAIFSQVPQVKASLLPHVRDLSLKEQFHAYTVYEINTAQVAEIVRNPDFGNRIGIELPGYGLFQIDLFENRLLSERFVLSVMSEDGLTTYPWDGIVRTFKGNLKGGQYNVSLTIDGDYLAGFIELPQDEVLYIEPLRHFIPGAGDAVVVAYKASAIRDQGGTCGTDHTMVHQERSMEQRLGQQGQRQMNDCKEVEIAYADDWLMYQKYNQNQNNVINHNMTVMNNVQNNYDNEFQHELLFEVVQIWISTCSTCDPWTSSTDAGVLLGSFRTWGNSGGFSTTYDVANLWTNRNFDGSTIGISWVDAVCTSFRYLTTQDFSNNQGALRSLLAHELGHNFGSNHDPSGSNTIMAPSLVITNNWSSSSINQINNYVNSINCLGPCINVSAPLADFSASQTEGCTPFVVNFFDESTGPPASWLWTFPGGSPASSTQQNPTVTYLNPGSFDVTLQVTNAAGTNTKTVPNYITVHGQPIADWFHNQIDLTVQFTSISLYADTYFWQFGDGFNSFQQNPSHTYAEDGVYIVSLTVTNFCGSHTYTEVIEIYTPPQAGIGYDVNSGCEPLTVQFLNESSSNSQSFYWYFPGGTPASSTLENPLVIYHNAGIYPVTLIVENIAGIDELTINNLIHVFPDPLASFSYVVDGLSVQFSNTSQNATEYLWAFGDGNTSTQVSPNHTYATGGQYFVTLTAFNDCGSQNFVLPLSISAAPIAAFTVSASSGCVPLTVTYTSTSSGVVDSYNWSFPGGTPSSSTMQSQQVVYNAPGTYSAQLIVSNTIGSDTLLLPDAVVVHPDPISVFVAEIDGLEVHLTNQSSHAGSYTWIIEDVPFVTEHLDYTFGNDGEYPVMLIATNACGNDTSVQLIIIATPPVAGVASNVTSGCEPLTVQFFNSSSLNATEFAWVFEGGNPATSSEPNPVVQYDAPGVYAVSLTVWSAGGMDELVIDEMIEVYAQPVAAFFTIQDGLEIEFDNQSESGTNYFWSFGDGVTSNDSDPIHTYEDYGTYTIVLITTNTCGSDTVQVDLVVSQIPVPVFNAVETHGCVPFEVQFIDMSQNGVETWEWTFAGGEPAESTEQNPVVTYHTPGIYSVTLRVGNAAGAQALVRDEYIHVGMPPVAEFEAVIAGGTVTFENTSSGGAVFIWQYGDGVSDTTLHGLHTYQASGTYQVELIAINPCGADTAVQDVTVTITSVSDPSGRAELRIFPNPNTGVFSMIVSGIADPFDLTILDALGRTVGYSRMQTGGDHQQQIMLTNVVPGVYLVAISRPGIRIVERIVVMH